MVAFYEQLSLKSLTSHFVSLRLFARASPKLASRLLLNFFLPKRTPDTAF